MKLYPWGGKFTEGESTSPIAIVTLSDDLHFPEDKIAVWGALKTENLGVEKVVANIISNPHIRYLIVAGREVKGHQSGSAIINLHKNGLDEQRRIIGAKSAIPYIENLPDEAITRFQKQVEIIDLTDVADTQEILQKAIKLLGEKTESFGEPLIVEPVEKKRGFSGQETDFTLHAKISLDPYGIVSKIKQEYE